MQFQQHARQLLAGYVKQRGVGEYTIEIVIRQIELEKILLPNFAAAVSTRHVGEMCGAFQTDRDVAQFGKHFEVSPGPAAKIKYCKTRLTLDVLQHRRDVLADIVIARACPELFGALVIMFPCKGDYFLQVLRIQFHILSPHKGYAISGVRKIVKWYFSFVTNCKLDAFRGSWSVNESQYDSTRMPCASENIRFRPL